MAEWGLKCPTDQFGCCLLHTALGCVVLQNRKSNEFSEAGPCQLVGTNLPLHELTHTCCPHRCTAQPQNMCTLVITCILHGAGAKGLSKLQSVKAASTCTELAVTMDPNSSWLTTGKARAKQRGLSHRSTLFHTERYFGHKPTFQENVY